MIEIENRLQAIEQRNIRVETDKAWERSMTRRISISLLTYLTASIFLWFIGVTFPFISALVPAGGYVLSTLSLPWIKKHWINSVMQKKVHQK